MQHRGEENIKPKGSVYGAEKKEALYLCHILLRDYATYSV